MPLFLIKKVVMAEFIDKDPKWSDLSEFEFPASFLSGNTIEINKTLPQKLFSKINYLTQIIQFKASQQHELSILKERLSFFKKSRASIIKTGLLNTDTYPNQVKKNLDTLTAYIEEVVYAEELKKVDDQINITKKKIINAQEDFNNTNDRCIVLQHAIDVGVSVLSAHNNIVGGK